MHGTHIGFNNGLKKNYLFTRIFSCFLYDLSRNSQIWVALPANFLTIRVWEGTRAIQDDIQGQPLGIDTK